MSKKMLIDAAMSDQVRVAVVEDGKLVELEIESSSTASLRGNIYKGIVKDVVHSLNAAFIDFGEERDGFLSVDDINPSLYPKGRSRRDGIRALLHRGQDLVVQVVRDAVGNKGCSLTTNLSLAGRYTVLMVGPGDGGVSKKVEDEERKRMRKILEGLKVPEGTSVILRTAGAKQTKTKIQTDVNRLGKLLRGIMTRAKRKKEPGLLHQESDLVLRALRDYFDRDVSEVLVSSEEAYKRAESYCRQVMPNMRKRVKLYSEAAPLFVRYQVEEQVSQLFQRQVPLPSGGSIVIDQTEALVAIDVNSGKATQKKSIEQTALLSNLEAAEEIARQLRLRDLGGLIVIDFIDMRDSKHKNELERVMRSHLKIDKARTKTGRLSKFGLMEMSRQRIKPSIESASFEPCRYCRGKGLTPSTETLALGFLRELRLKTLKGDIAAVNGKVPMEVADYLLNKKRSEILELESRRNLSIIITPDSRMIPGESSIACEEQ